MPTFNLSKWYFDCVSHSGDPAILYTGTLEYGPLRLHYSSLLDHAGTRHSLRRHREPLHTGRSITWQSPTLKIDAEWTLNPDSVRATIIPGLDWHCLTPCAPARINDVSGLGYVEHLTLTVPPWDLPIRTLRWGRFTCPSHSLVWIDWRGNPNRQFVFLDGARTTAATLDDSALHLAHGATLTMDRSLLLRDGPLGSTVLSNIPRLKNTRLLRIHETKWRSRALLTQPGSPAVEGWAIHEKVDWP
jgi:hypothetical protein